MVLRKLQPLSVPHLSVALLGAWEGGPDYLLLTCTSLEKLLPQFRPLPFLISSGRSHTCLPGWLCRFKDLGRPHPGEGTDRQENYNTTKGPSYPRWSGLVGSQGFSERKGYLQGCWQGEQGHWGWGEARQPESQGMLPSSSC